MQWLELLFWLGSLYIVRPLVFSSLLWMPFLQWWLVKRNTRGTVRTAIALNFVPGAVLTGATWLFIVWGFNYIVRRQTLVDALIGSRAFVWFWLFWKVTGTLIGLWFIAEAVRAVRQIRVGSLWRRTLAMTASTLLLISLSLGATLYVRQYRSLQDAVQSGELELARRRLQFNLEGLHANNGFVFSYSDYDDLYPLLPIAAANGDIPMAQLLLDHGADLDAASYDGRRPVVAAMEEGHEGMLLWLLDRGADQSLALHWFAKKNDVDTLKRLVLAGANPHARDERGTTPLDAAASYRADDAYEYLATFGEILFDLKGLIHINRIDLLEKALRGGADPNRNYGSDRPPLAYAIERGNLEAVHLLVKFGADNRSYDYYGRREWTWPSSSILTRQPKS